MTETIDVRLFPPPGALATPTDLNEDDARKVTEAVNPLVADAFALYVKTKNYRWHLSGRVAAALMDNVGGLQGAHHREDRRRRVRASRVDAGDGEGRERGLYGP